MAAGIERACNGPRSAFHERAPLASRRRPVFDRDSGEFLAARPPVRSSTLDAQRSTESPRVAATANLDVPDDAPRDLGLGTPGRDALMLALAFAIGIGAPAVWLVIRAQL